MNRTAEATRLRFSASVLNIKDSLALSEGVSFDSISALLFTPYLFARGRIFCLVDLPKAVTRSVMSIASPYLTDGSLVLWIAGE